MKHVVYNTKYKDFVIYQDNGYNYTTNVDHASDVSFHEFVERFASKYQKIRGSIELNESVLYLTEDEARAIMIMNE